MKFPDFPSELEAKTLQMLRGLDRSVSFKKVAEDTGLSEGWLLYFFKSKLKHPSVGRVETLYNYLSPTKLKV